MQWDQAVKAKKHLGIIGHAIGSEDMEVADSSRALQSDFNISRLTSPSLDPQKHWYVLAKEICGVQWADFLRNEMFRRFPDEIQSVATWELQPTKLAFVVVEFNRLPSIVIVTSMFGLIAGLIHHKGIAPHIHISSPHFQPIVGLLNSVAFRFGQ